ncbi:hypothetical protein HDV04_003790 [Boothiomyces sp. JEL0838]|nr:hypothetical protein HDV04_003790 [Boothiomyces sp. JEL0838]
MFPNHTPHHGHHRPEDMDHRRHQDRWAYPPRLPPPPIHRAGWELPPPPAPRVCCRHETEVHKLNEYIDQVQMDRNRQVGSMKHTINDLAQTLTNRDNTIIQLQKNLERAENILKQKDIDIGNYENNLRSLENQLESYKKTIEKQKATISEFEREREKKRESLRLEDMKFRRIAKVEVEPEVQAPPSPKIGWKPWTEVIRSKYPTFKTTATAHFSTFFKSFKTEHKIEDVNIARQGFRASGALPEEYHEMYIKAFEKEFGTDSLNFVRQKERDENDDSKDDNRKLIVWKEVIKKGYPSFKSDATIEKRVRQYLIPEELAQTFVQWFKELEREGFKRPEKRKAESSNESNKKHKKDEDEEPFALFDLALIDTKLETVKYKKQRDQITTENVAEKSQKEPELTKANDRTKFNRTVPKLMRSSTISIDAGLGKYNEDLHDQKRKLDEIDNDRNQKRFKDISIVDQPASDVEMSFNESVILKDSRELDISNILKSSTDLSQILKPKASVAPNQPTKLSSTSDRAATEIGSHSHMNSKNTSIEIIESNGSGNQTKEDSKIPKSSPIKETKPKLDQDGLSLAQIRKDLAAKRNLAKLNKPMEQINPVQNTEQLPLTLPLAAAKASIQTQNVQPPAERPIKPQENTRNEQEEPILKADPPIPVEKPITDFAEKTDDSTKSINRDSMIIDDNISRPIFNSLSPIAPKNHTSIDTNISDDDMILDADMSIDFSSANNISKETRLSFYEQTLEKPHTKDTSKSDPTPKVAPPIRKLELPIKMGGNIYKGNASTFLPTKEPTLVEAKSGISTFITQQPKTIAKPKPPPVKALQQAALAAKREAEEKLKKQQQKEQRLKLLQKKEEEKKPIIRRPLELPKAEDLHIKKPMEKSKLDEPLKKKIGPPLLTSKPLVSSIAVPKEKPKLPLYWDKSKQPTSKLKPALPPKPQEKEVNPTIVDPKGELPDIPSSEEDSDEDLETPKKQKVPKWAQTPYLKAHLSRQENINPDNIFDEIPTPNIKDMMDPKVKMRESMFMSSNEKMEDLTAEEMREYRINMGFE